MTSASAIAHADRPGMGAWSIAIIVALSLALAILLLEALAIYAIFGVLGFALFLRYPVLGLYATTALLLLSGSATVVGDLRVHIPLTASKVCGMAAFTAWLTNCIVRKQRLHFTGSEFVLLIFLAWCLIGVFRSPTWEIQWAEWIRVVTLVAYFYLAVNLLNTPRRMHTFTMLILICGVAMAVFAIFQYFLPSLHLEIETAEADIGVRAEGAYIDYDSLEGGPAVRVSGGAGHSNWLALVILVILPMNAYWFMVAKRRWTRALALMAVLLEVVALVLTFTRTGFFVGVIVLTLLGLRNMVQFTPQRVCAVALVLFLGWFALPDAYKERVLDFPQYTRSESIFNRMELQESAWNLTLRNPIWGVGLGGYGPHLLEENSGVARTMRWFVDRYDWPPQFIGTHNLYLQLSAETGIVGLGLMLLFFALVLRDIRRANRAFTEMGDADGMALTSSVEVGFIAFLLCGVFLHGLQQKIWWMVAALAAAAPVYQAAVASMRTDSAPNTKEPIA